LKIIQQTKNFNFKRIKIFKRMTTQELIKKLQLLQKELIINQKVSDTVKSIRLLDYAIELISK
jgi:hypothetical protein